jgi:hypothetical protein
MQQQNFNSNLAPVKIAQPPLTVKSNLLLKRMDSKVKSCRHRNENGWCSKGQRQCLLVTELYFKH